MNFPFLKNKKTKISLVVRDGEGEVKEKSKHFLRKTKELKKNNNLILFPKPPSVNNAFLTLFLRTWPVRGVDGDWKLRINFLGIVEIKMWTDKTQ